MGMDLVQLIGTDARNFDDAHTINPNERDLSPFALDESGRLKIMPAEFYATTTMQERGLFGYKNGVYSLPTVELIDWLKVVIDGRDAIEIGAGNGVIAEALGIRATDSKMQDDPEVQKVYRAMADQPTVKYGPNVEKIDARAAVRKYRPRVVVASWVTHKWDERKPNRKGNMFGVDERDILENCEHYVFIGNTRVHELKPLWSKPTILLEQPDWLYSRAQNGTPEFVAIWKGRRK